MPSPSSYLLGLIGSGIQASRTPAMHMAEGARQGLAYVYKLIDLAPHLRDPHVIRIDAVCHHDRHQWVDDLVALGNDLLGAGSVEEVRRLIEQALHLIIPHERHDAATVHARGFEHVIGIWDAEVVIKALLRR